MPGTITSRPNQVRIIGGSFRSRKLAFPAIAGLRPTGDRIRETLFNWLAPHIHGSRCLDLFAGSGALGIEALSRGASHVTFIDSSRQACDAIRHNLDILDPALQQAGKARVICSDSLSWLESACKTATAPVDIVFVDPPFATGLFEASTLALDRSGLLHTDALVYLEQPRQRDGFDVPEHWQNQRDKHAGSVRYRLLQVSAQPNTPQS